MKAKVGLIGVSGYGATHFAYLRKLAERGLAEITAATVINPEQVPDQLTVLWTMGSRVFPSADALFGEKE